MFEPRRIARRVRWRVAAELNRLRLRVGDDFLSAKFPNALFSSVLYIDPLKISWRCKMRSKEQSSSRMFPDGSWDLSREAMLTYESYDYRYISCRQIISQGLGFKETEEYAVYIDKLSDGILARGMSTVKDIDAYMSSLERFYREASRVGGLKTQQQLGESPFCGEINFVVGRDGELLKADDGNHRFAIARVCNFPKIPIQVSMVHPSLFGDLVENRDVDYSVKVLRDYLHDLASRYS